MKWPEILGDAPPEWETLLCARFGTENEGDAYYADAVEPLIDFFLDEAAAQEQWIDDLQSKGWVNCVYCGKRYGARDEQLKIHETMRGALAEHAEACPKHPLFLMKKRAEYAEAQVEYWKGVLSRTNKEWQKNLEELNELRYRIESLEK